MTSDSNGSITRPARGLGVTLDAGGGMRHHRGTGRGPGVVDRRSPAHADTRRVYPIALPFPNTRRRGCRTAPYHSVAAMPALHTFTARRPDPAAPARLGRLITPHGV